MKSPTIHDLEALSAYLDGELTSSEKAKLEKRILADKALATVFFELRETRALLRKMSRRKAPRNFTLKAGMPGVRAPRTPFVPALAWASAVSMVLFIFTLVISLGGQSTATPAAPMLAGAPQIYGTVEPTTAPQALRELPTPTCTPKPSTSSPMLTSNHPADTGLASTPEEAPKMLAGAAETPIPEEATPSENFNVMAAPLVTTEPVESAAQPPSAFRPAHNPLNIWLYIWPVLGVFLALLAVLVGWLRQRAFLRKNH
jgi:hypothetical protein